MVLTDHKMPTLGYFNKVLCECLGLWASDNNGVTFTLPATEQRRRAALNEAFEAIRRADGYYGSLSELIAVTTQLAPGNVTLSKKDRTVQAEVHAVAGRDFASPEEAVELAPYIEGLIEARYARFGVAALAVGFYRSALLHYREFLRECPATQVDTYQLFLTQTLRPLVSALVCEQAQGGHCPGLLVQQGQWPLLDFFDAALNRCGISRHKLYQFHECAKGPGRTDAEVWASDLKSLPTDTRAKQTVGRFAKPNRIKFSRVYETVRPLAHLLRDEVDAGRFANQVFAAFICHNLVLQASERATTGPAGQAMPCAQAVSGLSSVPASDALDLLLARVLVEDPEPGAGAVIDPAMQRYRQYTTHLQAWSLLARSDLRLPASLDFWYGPQYDTLGAGRWRESAVGSPNWMREWRAAVQAAASGQDLVALEHFQAALAGAMYTAGPLFNPLYVEICAFCKGYFQRQRALGDTADLSEAFDALGTQACRYAGMIGYTPETLRDPATLIPRAQLRAKNGRILQKIDSLVKC